MGPATPAASIPPPSSVPKRSARLRSLRRWQLSSVDGSELRLSISSLTRLVKCSARSAPYDARMTCLCAHLSRNHRGVQCDISSDFPCLGGSDTMIRALPLLTSVAMILEIYL